MTKNHCYFRQFLVKTTFFYILTLMTDPNFDEIPAYIPKKGEEFMSSGQLKHFIHKLNVWRDQLVSEAESTINHIQERLPMTVHFRVPKATVSGLEVANMFLGESETYKPFRGVRAVVKSGKYQLRVE